MSTLRTQRHFAAHRVAGGFPFSRIEAVQRFIEDEVRAIGRYRHGKLYLLLHSCREFTGRLVEIWGDSEGVAERVDVGGRFPRLPNESKVLDGR